MLVLTVMIWQMANHISRKRKANRKSANGIRIRIRTRNHGAPGCGLLNLNLMNWFPWTYDPSWIVPTELTELTPLRFSHRPSCRRFGFGVRTAWELRAESRIETRWTENQTTSPAAQADSPGYLACRIWGELPCCVCTRNSMLYFLRTILV